jgi:hypothetical protein
MQAIIAASPTARGFFRDQRARGVTCAFEPRGIFMCPLCFPSGTLAQRWVPETPPGQVPLDSHTLGRGFRWQTSEIEGQPSHAAFDHYPFREGLCRSHKAANALAWSCWRLVPLSQGLLEGIAPRLLRLLEKSLSAYGRDGICFIAREVQHPQQGMIEFCPLSLPKIISARSDDAIQIELAWR